MLSGASLLLFAQRQQRNSSCCGTPSGKGPGYGGSWHCPPLRDARSLTRTLSGHCSPRPILAAQIGLFFPGLTSSEIHGHNNLECSEQPQWFGEKQKFAEEAQDGSYTAPMPLVPWDFCFLRRAIFESQRCSG